MDRSPNVLCCVRLEYLTRDIGRLKTLLWLPYTNALLTSKNPLRSLIQALRGIPAFPPPNTSNSLHFYCNNWTKYQHFLISLKVRDLGVSSGIPKPFPPHILL